MNIKKFLVAGLLSISFIGGINAQENAQTKTLEEVAIDALHTAGNYYAYDKNDYNEWYSKNYTTLKEIIREQPTELVLSVKEKVVSVGKKILWTWAFRGPLKLWCLRETNIQDIITLFTNEITLREQSQN